VLESAVALTGADGAGLTLRDGEVFRSHLTIGYSEAEIAQRAGYLKRLEEGVRAGDRSTLIGRVAQARRTTQIPDASADAEYDFQGWRALLGVPLLRDDDCHRSFDRAPPRCPPVRRTRDPSRRDVRP